MEGIISVVNFDADMHNAENSFTQSTVSSLANQYPEKNILVFHDTDSTGVLGTFSLFSKRVKSPSILWIVNSVYTHFELDIGFGLTQGYEIYVFDYGTFSLVGDGGYENWALEGCFDGPRSAVVFCSRVVRLDITSHSSNLWWLVFNSEFKRETSILNKRNSHI